MPFLFASDCLISAYTPRKDHSKSIMQAISLSVAPVMTKIGDQDGLEENGISGWVIPSKIANAITSVIPDRAMHLEEQRGFTARLHIEEDSHIEKSMKELHALYTRLMDGTEKSLERLGLYQQYQKCIKKRPVEIICRSFMNSYVSYKLLFMHAYPFALA